ncbi:MAG: radical SAM protein, partial [Desulfosalsimonadaceae bacterium]|nr:radical SAM protein [Desulfosalsimonadaceae bacterium]
MSSSAKPLIIPIFLPHAGCPHVCVFCNQRAITGSHVNFPTSNDIRFRVHEFLSYKRASRSGVEISFYGGNFLGLPAKTIQDLLDLASEFAGTGKIDGIRFSTRPDTIDEERLKILDPYPVSTVELGVQSMDDGVLREAGRDHTAADTVHAVRLLKQKNYRIGLQMMTGLPGDTDAVCLQTARRIIALKPDFVRIYPTLVICGSYLAEMYQQGRYAPQSMDDCIALLKTLVLLFQENGISVIRMGLQASDGLDDPAIVLAGPYHPALGHMVYSRILLDTAIEQLTAGQAPGKTVTITVHPRSLSRMQGLNKTNIDILKHRFHIETLYLTTD